LTKSYLFSSPALVLSVLSYPVGEIVGYGHIFLRHCPLCFYATWFSSSVEDMLDVSIVITEQDGASVFW